MDINTLREEMRDLASEVSIESIADLYKLTPEQVQVILDGGEIEIEETVQNEQPVMVFKATTRVEKQKVFAIWRAGGGVGATAVAVTLAKMVSEKMKTLYICCNFSDGGSDAIQYLNLPYFPREKFTVDPVIPVPGLGHENLFAIPPITQIKAPISPDNVQRVILNAREKYDCIVLDLPNSQDETTLAAAQCATHIIWVVGSPGEAQRVDRLMTRFRDKDQYIIANRLSQTDLLNVISADVEKVVEIVEDPDMEERLPKGRPLSLRSSFYQGLSKVYELIYKEKPNTPAITGGNEGFSLKYHLSSGCYRLKRNLGSVTHKFSRIVNFLSGPAYLLGVLIVVCVALISGITLLHHYIDNPLVDKCYVFLVDILGKLSKAG